MYLDLITKYLDKVKTICELSYKTREELIKEKKKLKPSQNES